MSVSEYWEKYRLGEAIREGRRRVVADFHDFRFTRQGFIKWAVTVVLALLFAALVILYFLDWNQLRGPIGRFLSYRTGREVRIDGNLKVDLFTWQPSIDAGGVFIGNPGWVARSHAATVKDFRLEMRLLPLILGDLVLPLVYIDHPDILLTRNASGRTNWGGIRKNGDAWDVPLIRRLVIHDGHVEIDDAVRQVKFTGAMSSWEEQGDRNAAFVLTGGGTLNGNKFLAHVKGGPLLNVDARRPYDFTADLHAGGTHAVVKGALTQPFHLDRYNATATITGPNLADLYYLTGLVLPGTPSYRLSSAVVRDGPIYSLSELSGEVGQSDLSGDLTVDTSGKITSVNGRLASRSLSFDDLGSLVGGGKNAAAVSKYLLPDTALHTDRLRQMNAQIDYTATRVKSRDFPLTSLVTHVSLDGGVLKLEPLALGFTQGKLSGSIKIDARGQIPVTGIDARITDVHVEHFIKGSKKPVEGILEARAQLSGTGNSVHRAASTAVGTLTAVLPSGKIRRSLAEWLGVNVISALGLTLAGDNSDTNVRCAVAHFSVKDGTMMSQQFIFDTNPVRVGGRGAIDLRNETMDLTLTGEPKSFQILRLRAPITVKGSLAHPVLGVDAKPTLTQGGIAVALGMVNPFAAILAFIDPGLAKDADCARLLTTAKARGAPAKLSTITTVVRARK